MLGFIDLFKTLRKFKVQRKHYHIKPEIRFGVDTKNFIFSLIPTVMVVPWVFRYHNEPIIDIQWLHLHITIGKWKRKED